MAGNDTPNCRATVEPSHHGRGSRINPLDRFVASEHCGYCFEGPKLGWEIETKPVEALEAFTDIRGKLDPEREFLWT